MAVWKKIKYKAIVKTGYDALTVFSLAIIISVWAIPVLGDVFDVEGVLVDVTANTAAEAKNKAIKIGERQALYSLISKLTIRSTDERIPQLSSEKISNYIHNFSVSGEKTSDIRYIAKLNFRFKKEAMHQLFEEYGVLFAETLSKPVLILPVLRKGGAIMLWDDLNLWRQAWNQYKNESSLVPIIVPLGDLKDVAVIGAEQALNNDLSRLAAIAKRYNAGTVAIAIATVKSSQLDKNIKIEIEIIWDGITGVDESFFVFVKGKKTDTLRNIFFKAVSLVSEQIEDNWKQGNLVGLDNKMTLNVSVPISSLNDWLLIRKQLKRVQILRYVKLVFLSLEEIRLHLKFLGNTEKLVMALAQEDLSLILDQEEWLLIPSSPGATN